MTISYRASPCHLYPVSNLDELANSIALTPHTLWVVTQRSICSRTESKAPSNGLKPIAPMTLSQRYLNLRMDL